MVSGQNSLRLKRIWNNVKYGQIFQKKLCRNNGDDLCDKARAVVPRAHLIFGFLALPWGMLPWFAVPDA
jgi:hypothetical protein